MSPHRDRLPGARVVVRGREPASDRHTRMSAAGSMGAMQTVLVPVDGSPSAQRAVEWIGQVLGRQTGAHVHLVNVQPAIDAWEVASHLGAGEIAQWQAATAAGVLDPAAKRLLAAGITVTTHARVGDVATTIAGCTRDLQCDAIVMGARGLGAVQSLLLGSTALKVVHLADVPVTLIK